MDFDLLEHFGARLADVPSTVGWGAVALFLRHMPYNCATSREMHPERQWSVEAHLLANLVDLLGAFLAGHDYRPQQRPGATARYQDAEQVDALDYDRILSRFRGGGDDAG